jgi:hypothetical protein
MAITVVQESKDLIMTFVKEIKNEQVVYETRRIRNLKVDSLPEDLHEVALKITALSEQEGGEIKVQDVSSIETI